MAHIKASLTIGVVKHPWRQESGKGFQKRKNLWFKYCIKISWPGTA